LTVSLADSPPYNRRNKLFYRAPKISLYSRWTGDDTLNKCTSPEGKKMTNKETAKEIIGMVGFSVWFILIVAFAPALFQ
jgi:hypothetical protein